MIQKITSEGYLKRYDNMTGTEKAAVMKRVGEWLNDSAKALLNEAELPAAHLQSVLQVSQSWDDKECERWTEGVRLMTAFVGMTDTWLPEHLYIKAARRSIRRLIEVLTEQYDNTPIVPENKPLPKPDKLAANVQTPGTPPIPMARRRGRPRKVQPDEPDLSQGIMRQAVSNSFSAVKTNTIVPRPKHIDQYVHLLPEETQKRAADYGPLMRDLETARQNMLLLMNDPHSNSMEREKWAKLAVKIDGQIASIRKELDTEWSKLASSGKVIVDDLGMAHVINAKTGEILDPRPKKADKKPKEPKAEDKPKRSHHKQLTEEEKAKRLDYLKKWLRDARPAVTDERRKQWEQNCRELLKLGGKLTGSIIKAGEHYGVKTQILRQKTT